MQGVYLTFFNRYTYTLLLTVVSLIGGCNIVNAQGVCTYTDITPIPNFVGNAKPYKFYHADGSDSPTFYRGETIFSYAPVTTGACRTPNNNPTFIAPIMPSGVTSLCTPVNGSIYYEGVQTNGLYLVSGKRCQRIGPTLQFIYSQHQKFSVDTPGTYPVTFQNGDGTVVNLTIVSRVCVKTDCGTFAGIYEQTGMRNGKVDLFDQDGNELYFENNKWLISNNSEVAFEVASTSDYPPTTGWQPVLGCKGTLITITEGNCPIPVNNIKVTITNACEYSGVYEQQGLIENRPSLFGPNGGRIFYTSNIGWVLSIPGNINESFVRQNIFGVNSREVLPPTTGWIRTQTGLLYTCGSTPPNYNVEILPSTFTPVVRCVRSNCGNIQGIYTQTRVWNERPDLYDEDQNRMFYWGAGDANRPEGWYITNSENKFVYYNNSNATNPPTTGWQAFTGDGVSCTNNVGVFENECPPCPTTQGIAYGSASYCKNLSEATVTITGSTGGAFTSTSGLSIDTNSGTINPSASTAGTYIVTYSLGGTNGCAVTTVTAPVTINDLNTPLVAITANPSGVITPGTSVTFTATPTNGGTTPTYVWKKNDVTIPNEVGATYTTTTLANGDKIKVEMTSNAVCPLPTTVTSNELTMEINPCLNVTNRLYVTPTGTGNGSSWANATSDLQAAIDNTCGVTEIWVAAGTYIPQKDPFGNANPADPRDKTFYLKDGIAIYGGFAGTETDRSQRNPATNVTILSGDIGTPNDPSDNCYHVAISVLDGPNTVLDGFKITKGTNVGTFAGQRITVEGYIHYRGAGAGLSIQDCEITVNNCVFEDNAGYAGGGIYVYMESASPTISHCQFRDNKPVGGSASGLGISLEAYGEGEISITNCDFSANSGANNGGAVNIYADNSSDINFIDCKFSGNMATFGGAVELYVDGTNNISFDRCVFNQNNATSGGAIYQSEGLEGDTFSYTNSLFVGNQSTEDGGAIYLTGTVSTISNCTIFNNSTTSQTSNSGAIYAPNGGLTVVNSILWNNTSGAGSTQSQIDTEGETLTVSYSIVQGSSVLAGTGNSNADPVFVNASDPDGADNIFATTDDGLTLRACSPALNAGNNPVVTSTLDLPKATRIQNTTVDMGAYESASLPAFITPAVSIASNDADNSIVAGTSVTFTATPTNGGSSPTYVWKKNNITIPNEIGTTYTTTTLADGDKIKVEMTSSAVCASPNSVTSNEITMIVCSRPTLFMVSGGGQTCPGGSGVTIVLSGSQVGVNYQLRRGNNNVGNPQPGTGAGLNFTNQSVAGTYTVVATTATGSCSSLMNGSVEVSTSTPASATISANQSICAGAVPANVTLTDLVGAVVRWQRATNANFTGATDLNVTSTTLSGLTLGELSADTWVRAVIQNGNCPPLNTSAVRITVQQSFTATAEASSNLICSNQTLRLTALPDQAGLTYNWRGPANFSSTLQSPTRTGLTTAMSGTYSVTVSRSACNLAATTTVSVIVSPSGTGFAPQMSQLRFNNTVPNAQTNTVSVCAGSEVTLQITANQHALTYNWRGPAGGNGSGFMSAPANGVTNASASISAAIAANQQGQYTVTVRNGCSVINQRVINLQVRNCSSARLAAAEASLGLDISVSPNPVRDIAEVSVRGVVGENVRLSLHDAQGRSLQQTQIEVVEGKAHHRFDLRSLPTGLYVLQAESLSQQASKKVIRVN